MNTLIRRNCFETNSSSSHSVSIAGTDKDFVLDTIYPDENGVIELNLRYFGWDWFKHNDAETKAIYALVAANGDSAAEQMIIDLIKEQTGAEKVVVVVDNEAGIDHQSVGTFYPSDRDTTRNFIFNKNSWLFGGNDNETPAPGFYETEKYALKNGKVALTKVKPLYFMDVPILNVPAIQFSHEPTEDEIKDAIHWAMGTYDSCLIPADKQLAQDYLLRRNGGALIDRDFDEVRRADGNYENGYEHTYDVTTKTGRICFVKVNSDYKDRHLPENQRFVDFAVKVIPH